MNSKVDKLYKKIYNDKKDVIFFGLSYCEYCKKTLELLKKNKISYKYYTIDKYYNIFFNVLNEVLKLYPNLEIDQNHKTVPVIFFKKKFVGGYIELKKIFN
jgi:glutaredoxin